MRNKVGFIKPQESVATSYDQQVIPPQPLVTFDEMITQIMSDWVYFTKARRLEEATRTNRLHEVIL